MNANERVVEPTQLKMPIGGPRRAVQVGSPILSISTMRSCYFSRMIGTMDTISRKVRRSYALTNLGRLKVDE